MLQMYVYSREWEYIMFCSHSGVSKIINNNDNDNDNGSDNDLLLIGYDIFEMYKYM